MLSDVSILHQLLVCLACGSISVSSMNGPMVLMLNCFDLLTLFSEAQIFISSDNDIRMWRVWRYTFSEVVESCEHRATPLTYAF